jgi:hypothetical protein
MNPSLQAAKYALLAVTAVFVWQSANVRFNYGGEWNALFLAGDRFETPAALAAETIPQLPDSDGYDGQFYHYIAHDPLLTKGLAMSVDDPGLRWRRILVPGLAALLAVGQSNYVDGAYLLVIYLCLGCGVFWLSLLAMHYGRHPVWGLCFVAIPAAAISVERLTVDVALAAITVGYCFYALRWRSAPTWLLLALAPLARETGVALLAVHAAYAFAAQRWRELTAAILCGVPFLAWALYVASMTAPSDSAWLGLPFWGLIARSIDVLPLPLSGSQALVAMTLDYAGVVGVWVALIQSVMLLWPHLKSGPPFAATPPHPSQGREPLVSGLSPSMGPVEWGVAFFALAAVLLGSPKVWAGSYAFGRVLSPWLIFLLLIAIRDRRYWFAAPTVLMGLHAAAQAAVHLVGMARHVLNG